MMKGNIGKEGINLFYPFIGKNLATGITETGFTIMRNNYILVGMHRTGILMITKFFWISAGKYLLYCSNDIIMDRISVSG